MPFKPTIIKLNLSIFFIGLTTFYTFKPQIENKAPTHPTSFSIQKMNLSAHEAVISTGDNHLLHLRFEGELQNGELVVKSVHPVKVTDLNDASVSDYALDREDYERVVSVLEGA